LEADLVGGSEDSAIFGELKLDVSLDDMVSAITVSFAPQQSAALT